MDTLLIRIGDRNNRYREPPLCCCVSLATRVTPIAAPVLSECTAAGISASCSKPDDPFAGNAYFSHCFASRSKRLQRRLLFMETSPATVLDPRAQDIPISCVHNE